MDSFASRLAELVNAADVAYARARIEIYDTLPDGMRIDVSVLTSAQLEAFDDLVIAEAELAIFRHSHRETATVGGAVTPRQRAAW